MKVSKRIINQKIDLQLELSLSIFNIWNEGMIAIKVEIMYENKNVSNHSSSSCIN